MSKGNPEEDPRYLALIQLLRTADGIWKASRRFFERWNLSPSQFNVLNLLRLYPEGLSQTELSRYLLMHRSNITGLVDQLEREGLARREAVPDDRRAYRVVLTPEGSQILAQVLPGYYQGALSVWGKLPNRRLSEITAILEQVAGNAEATVVETKARKERPRAGKRSRAPSSSVRPPGTGRRRQGRGSARAASG